MAVWLTGGDKCCRAAFFATTPLKGNQKWPPTPDRRTAGPPDRKPRKDRFTGNCGPSSAAPALVRGRCGVALTVIRFIVQSDGVAPGAGEELVSGDWSESSMSATELPPGLVVTRG